MHKISKLKKDPYLCSGYMLHMYTCVNSISLSFTRMFVLIEIYIEPSFAVYQGNGHVFFKKCTINQVCPCVMYCIPNSFGKISTHSCYTKVKTNLLVYIPVYIVQKQYFPVQIFINYS